MNIVKRFAPAAARTLLGLVFFVFGLNGFLQFLPQPPAPEAAASFGAALAATGYMFPLIKGTEVVAGALLLSNRYVPLALALLAPIVVNIVAFHTFLTPPNPAAWLILALELYLAFAYRAAFRPMLAARVDAGIAASSGVERGKLSPVESAA
ncbi:DoxX family protein [Sorangium sp. So ce1014]|uniref:DoxX family protein n=1 Tax=Sorangium sp. So ce1014 TaxID=3133326 RepID=UPI003F5E6184